MSPSPNPWHTGNSGEITDSTDLTGIILAGGKSSRMGQEKGLVLFRDRALIEYGIDLLSSFTDKIMISSGNPDYLKYGLEMIPDEIAGQGPSAGLAAVLKRSSTSWNMIIACDLPFLEAELLHALLLQRGSFRAVIPIHQGVMEPLAGIYHKSLGLQFETAVLSGNLALHKILKSCHVNYVDSELFLKKFPYLFTNFNSMKEMDLFNK